MAKTQMLEPTSLNFPAVDFLTDKEAQDPSEALLNERVARYYELCQRSVACTVEMAKNSLLYAMALGQVFEIAFRRHEGSFNEWLLAAAGVDTEGNPNITDRTARNYRLVWMKRNQIFPKDGGEPTCRSLQDAYVKLGIMPPPLQQDSQETTPPVFRLTFKTPEIPPEQWPAADRRAFLERTEPIALLRERVAAIAA